MGRLFWKFFFFAWLAQMTAVFGVATYFWFERQQDHARWVAAGNAPGHPGEVPGLGPPLPELGPPPPPEGMLRPPGGPHPPPHHGGPPHGPRLPLVPIVAGVIVSLAFAALLAWYFAKPIRGLRAAFAAAAAGQLDARAGPEMGGRRDELADLGRDFDHMADRLRDLVDSQRRLLHDVSHELRSPLARLQAAIGLARQQPARLEDSMLRIERESVRMDRLVGELLTLSRLEAGVTPSMDEEIPVEELLADIVRDAGFEAEAGGRRVACAVAGEVTVRGNGELLQRAVENIVRNAIRHTHAGSEVRIEAGATPGGFLRLAVIDAGPGVPEGELAAIFEPFFRSGEAREGNGYGLGLAIARRVIEAHGGSIRAANRPEGGFMVEAFLPEMAPMEGRRA